MYQVSTSLLKLNYPQMLTSTLYALKMGLDEHLRTADRLGNRVLCSTSNAVSLATNPGANEANIPEHTRSLTDRCISNSRPHNEHRESCTNSENYHRLRQQETKGMFEHSTSR